MANIERTHTGLPVRKQETHIRKYRQSDGSIKPVRINPGLTKTKKTLKRTHLAHRRSVSKSREKKKFVKPKLIDAHDFQNNFKIFKEFAEKMNVFSKFNVTKDKNEYLRLMQARFMHFQFPKRFYKSYKEIWDDIGTSWEYSEAVLRQKDSSWSMNKVYAGAGWVDPELRTKITRAGKMFEMDKFNDPTNNALFRDTAGTSNIIRPKVHVITASRGIKKYDDRFEHWTHIPRWKEDMIKTIFIHFGIPFIESKRRLSVEFYTESAWADASDAFMDMINNIPHERWMLQRNTVMGEMQAAWEQRIKNMARFMLKKK